VLRRAGERLRLTDCATVAAAGLTGVSAHEPRIVIAPLRNDGIVDAAARLIAVDIARTGGLAQLADRGAGLADMLRTQTADAIVGIGGTGSGRNDDSVQVLAREGVLAVHGMALTPGETAALGFAGATPALLLPGRLDAAVCVWLTVGRPLLRQLSGAGNEHEVLEARTLARKIASTVGLTEVVPVRVQDGRAEPLAGKYLPLSALARSDGWVLVPAESEGYSAGSNVQVRPWP
jgi:molybdopterin biosynthesis enzyme